MNLELTDERIDAMRSQILDDVDADVARRGRRVRKAVVGGVGALALLTVIGVSVPSLTGGAPHDVVASSATKSDSVEAAPAPNRTDAGMPTTMKQMAPDAAGDYAATDGGDAVGPGEPVPPIGGLTAPGKNRDVITTGSVSVTISDPADAADRFTTWVQKHGGRVDGRTESRDHDGHTSATLTIRVPGKNVNAAVAELRKVGDVTSVDLQRDDVTAETQDLDARIKALKISVARLQGILERAGSSSEVIDAESALSDRQQQLEALETQRRSMKDQVTLSTITVDFAQESKPGSVAPGGFGGGLVKGWNALVDTVNAIVTAAGAALPWLGVGAVLGLIWWGIGRSRRRGRD